MFFFLVGPSQLFLVQLGIIVGLATDGNKKLNF